MAKPEVGMLVSINPQSDRTRKLIVQGVVAEVLTKTENHPHGMLVLLESGEKGRVKSIENQASLPNVDKTKDSGSKNLKSDIDNGENHFVEFKSSALWSFKFTNDDIKNHSPQSTELHKYGKNTSKVIISKTLAGFLNTDGGTLIIGVQENKDGQNDTIIGVETEFSKLKDPCEDGYRRMLIDVIKDNFPSDIFNHLNQYLKISFEEIEGKLVCGITALKSDVKVFLNLKKKDHFYIRTDASTRELEGEQIIDYCLKHFHK